MTHHGNRSEYFCCLSPKRVKFCVNVENVLAEKIAEGVDVTFTRAASWGHRGFRNSESKPATVSIPNLHENAIFIYLFSDGLYIWKESPALYTKGNNFNYSLNLRINTLLIHQR